MYLISHTEIGKQIEKRNITNATIIRNKMLPRKL